MDTYEILRSNSTAPPGSDVWTLINTQAGGTVIVGPKLSANADTTLSASIGDVLSVNLSMDILSANITLNNSANVDNDLEAKI